MYEFQLKADGDLCVANRDRRNGCPRPASRSWEDSKSRHVRRMLNFQDIQRVHPAGVAVLVGVILACFLLDRRYLVILFVATLSITPMSQRFVILGLDFPFSRIIIAAIVSRIVLWRLAAFDRIRGPDVIVVAWLIWSAIAQGFLFGDLKPVVTRLGYGVDALGAYFIGRSLIDSRMAFGRLCGGVAVCAILVIPVFLVEWGTGRNMFAALGGVPEATIVRDGRLRCQGPFTHPIMAGLFWGIWIPLILAWRAMETRQAQRSFALVGVAAILGIVVFTSSSTPVMAVLIGVGIFSLYRWRRFTAIMVTSIGLAMIPLHFMMDKGVLHLLARINIVSGSTGWHRYHLMDKAISNIGEWWAVGIQYTGGWGNGLSDVTNQLVLEGVRGGLLSLLLYVVFWLAILGRVVARASRGESTDCLYWGIFASLMAMFLSFIGVSIFGTVISQTFLLLGASMTLSADSTSRVKAGTGFPPAGLILRRESACRVASSMSYPGMKLMQGDRHS